MPGEPLGSDSRLEDPLDSETPGTQRYSLSLPHTHIYESLTTDILRIIKT